MSEYPTETAVLYAAEVIDMAQVKRLLADLPEDRLRDFIRALERAHDAAVRDLVYRHKGTPYSGMGGLLSDEVD